LKRNPIDEPFVSHGEARAEMLDHLLAREFAGLDVFIEAMDMTDIAGIANDRIDAGLLMRSSRGIQPKTGSATSLARISSTFMGPTLPTQFAGYRQRNRKQELSLPNYVAR
jgi:hypothetical protein